MIGFLLVDKPSEWTSHDVVAKVRRLIGIKKVGHAGTLDPMATGLIVLGVGRATKLLRFVQDLPKVYVARIKFGVATDSLDADGKVVSDEPMPFTRADLESALPAFLGEIDQVPPMVSAIKVDGRRLYELAREGIEIERQARQVTIHAIEVLDFVAGPQPEAEIRVTCGKGTYIRVLADDIAERLGGRAHLSALRRHANGSLTVEGHGVSLDELADLGEGWSEALLAPADALVDLPPVSCDQATARLVSHGRRFVTGDLGLVDASDGVVYRILDDSSGDLLAVYRVAGDQLVPEVVLS